MNIDDLRFQRFAAVTAMLVLPFTIANVVTLLASVNNDASAFFHPVALVSMGAKGADLMRLSMVMDLFSYLLVAPLVLWLYQRYKSKSPNFTRLYAMCGLAYCLLGAIGAVVVAEVVPTLAVQYSTAPAVQRPVLAMLISTFYQAVALGIWNPLEVLMASIWLLGMGGLMRKEHPVFGAVALGIGAFVLLDVLGRFLNNDMLFNLGALGMTLFPIWAFCFGIDLLRKPERVKASTVP